MRGAAPSSPLRIALLCPHAWPPRDDVAHHVAAEAAALARRGPPGDGAGARDGPGARGRRARPARGRRARATAPRLSPPGAGVLEVAVGRAVPDGRGPPGRRALRPGDLTLEEALSAAPLRRRPPARAAGPEPRARRAAPRPRRHGRHVPPRRAARGRRVPAAAPGPGPRAHEPAHRHQRRRPGALWPTSSRATTPGRPGVDAGALPAPGPRAGGPAGAGARGARARPRRRALRARRAARGLDLDALGAVTLIGPADAPWRTRAAVPKALRGTVYAWCPTPGPGSRAGRARRRAHRACWPIPARRRARCWPRRMAAGRASRAALRRDRGGRRHGVEGSCCRRSPATPGSRPSPSWRPTPARRAVLSAGGRRGAPAPGTTWRPSWRRATGGALDAAPSRRGRGQGARRPAGAAGARPRHPAQSSPPAGRRGIEPGGGGVARGVGPALVARAAPGGPQRWSWARRSRRPRARSSGSS